jgi:tetratricopeptide (TPR) repeat protein
MSLLMDALKRAETSKQDAARSMLGGERAQSENRLQLEPINPEQTQPTQSPLPDLASLIDAVDADLASTQNPTSPAPTQNKPPAKEAVAAQKAREAVRNAFAAKETPAPPSKAKLWWALGTLTIAALGIGGYVAYQLNAMGGNRIGSQVARPPVSQAPANPPTILPALPTTQPAPSATVFAQNSPSTVASARVVTATPGAASENHYPSPSPSEYTPRRQPPAQYEEGSAGSIRLTPSKLAPDENLVQAHDHIQKSQLDSARSSYEKALQRDPNNTDALLALAAIAQKQGRLDDADRYNQRALVANPADPASQAAMLSGATAAADPLTTESRLKILLASQPESAPLNFALGNLYSRQGRWADAQQAFFNSVAAEGDHPDYLFNLAVSLDHMRQNKLAAQHYRLALDAANKRPAAFDREQVVRRLSNLQAVGTNAR